METKLNGMGRASRRLGMALVVPLIGMTAVSTMAWAQPTALTAGSTAVAIDESDFSEPAGSEQGSPIPGTLMGIEYVGSGQSATPIGFGAIGSFTEEIYKSASGGLDFYYQVSLGSDFSPFDDTNVVSLSGFAGYKISVAYDDTGLGGTATVGDTADSPLNADLTNGGTVDFYWSPGSVPNSDTTEWLEISTNAPDPGFGTVTADDGNSGSGIADGASGTPVPEATTLLFGLGIACGIGAHFVRKVGPHSLWPVSGKELAV